MQHIRAVAALLFLVLFAGVVTGTTADRFVNSSEPAFLKDIGPQDARTDNQLAAIVTALAVGAVFYRGFRKYGNHGPQAEED